MGQFSDVFACSKMPRLGNGNFTSVHPLDLDGFRPVCLSYYTVCSHYRVLSFLGGSTVGADGLNTATTVDSRRETRLWKPLAAANRIRVRGYDDGKHDDRTGNGNPAAWPDLHKSCARSSEHPSLV